MVRPYTINYSTSSVFCVSVLKQMGDGNMCVGRVFERKRFWTVQILGSNIFTNSARGLYNVSVSWVFLIRMLSAHVTKCQFCNQSAGQSDIGDRSGVSMTATTAQIHCEASTQHINSNSTEEDRSKYIARPKRAGYTYCTLPPDTVTTSYKKCQFPSSNTLQPQIFTLTAYGS